MARRRNKGMEKSIAHSRIRSLLGRARDEALGPDADLADRHALLARRVAMRYQISLPREAKAQVCRACGAYLSPRTSRTRIQRSRIVTTCMRCEAVRRRPIR